MANRNYYVLCEDNCRFESMTKEQILTAIAQAVSTGEIHDVDTGFVSTVKTINGTPLKFFVGQQSEYESLTEDERKNLFAIITNDTTKEGILESIEALRNDLDGLTENLGNGDFEVANATNATNANKANKDYNGNIIHETYRKKEDALHNLSSENGLSSSYDIKNNTLKLPLREGKTASDIIGIRGQLRVTLSAIGAIGECVGDFSALWNAGKGLGLYEVITVVDSGSNAYVVWACLSISSTGELSCQYAYCIEGNEKKTANSVKIQSIYLYYK